METPLSEKLKALGEFMGGSFTETFRAAPKNIPVFAVDANDIEKLKYHTSWDWLIPVFSKFMKENSAEMNNPTFTVWRDFVLFVQNDDIKQAFETMYFAIEYMKREKLPENILKPKEL